MSTKSQRQIEESLGISTSESEIPDERFLVRYRTDLVPKKDVTEHDKSLDDDFNTVRNNILNSIENTKDYLDKMVRIADSEESPKAYEAVDRLLRTLLEHNSKLLALYEQRNKAKTPPEKDSGGPPSNVTNNTLFVGSGKELNKMIKEMNQNGVIDINEFEKTSSTDE